MNIELTLTTLTPYHSAPVMGGAFVVADNGNIYKKSGGASGLPLTRTYQEPVYIANKGEVEQFPVIRSLQIVKELRKITTRNIYQSLQDRNLQITKISTFAGMEVGAASGKPAQMKPTLDNIIHSLEKPIALFGGGSYSLSSLLSVGDGVILHESLLENNLVKKPTHIDNSLIAECENYQLTYPVPITRNDPINKISLDDVKNLKVVEEYQSQIKEWQGSVSDAQSKRKADAAEKKTDLNNLVSVEAVVKGVTFVSQLLLPSTAGLAAKGAVINALLELSREGITLGGRISRGMGKLGVTVAIDGNVLSDQSALANFEEELSEYSEWLDEVTPNDLSDFFEA